MSQIHPMAVVDESCKIGENVTIGPFCVIEEGCVIGDNTVLKSNVAVGKNVTIGKNNTLFPGCAIGQTPQILGAGKDAPIGKIVIGDNNVIREQVTIHPSMYTDAATTIGSNNLLMIGVHIGHDCQLEDRIVLSNYVQISGHCKIEMGVWLSGMVLVHQFITIGKWCYAAGMAGINHDIPPFLIVSGHYPPRIRGVNKRGLVRAGLDEHQQKLVTEAYKKIYRNKEKSLVERARDINKQENLDPNVKAMVDVIIRSSQHRFGRYLELFRH